MLSIALAGCETTLPTGMLGDDLLETAPQTDYDLMHPEWGVVQTTSVASNRSYSVQNSTHQQKTITTNYGRGVSTNDPLEVFFKTKPYRF